MDALLQKLKEIEAQADRRGSALSQQLADLKGVVEDLIQHTDERGGATARAVTRLAEGLRKSAELQAGEIEQMRQAILEMTAVIGRGDVSRMTGDALADYITLETASRARSVLWARKRGEPDPLPPLPALSPSGQEIVVLPEHAHDRKDDSITFQRGKDGETRLQISAKTKTLWAWIVAAVAGGMHLVRLVIDHWPKH